MDFPKPQSAALRYISNSYGFNVVDTPIYRNIMTEYPSYKLYQIRERSSNNKFIRVDIASETLAPGKKYLTVITPRHTRWIRFGSSIAKGLDKNRKLHLW